MLPLATAMSGSPSRVKSPTTTWLGVGESIGTYVLNQMGMAPALDGSASDTPISTSTAGSSGA